MLTLLLAFSVALAQEDFEPINAPIYHVRWAAALSAFEGKQVRPETVRGVVCFGLESHYVLCAWDQRNGLQWCRYRQYADISTETPKLRADSKREPGGRCRRR